MTPTILPRRDQADADALLRQLETTAAEDGILVGLTSADVATPIFTFVFGLARQGGRAAIVSTARLDPAFYGLPVDDDLRAHRTVLEILHEIGHVVGLAHCPDPSCLMNFAGTVEKVDIRGASFCPSCSLLLPRWIRPKPVAAS
jgi:archaemetzincin